MMLQHVLIEFEGRHYLLFPTPGLGVHCLLLQTFMGLQQIFVFKVTLAHFYRSDPVVRIIGIIHHRHLRNGNECNIIASYEELVRVTVSYFHFRQLVSHHGFWGDLHCGLFWFGFLN